MNKHIDRFLEKDIFIRSLSVFLALIVWLMVMDQENPLIERTISVPLQTNRHILDNRELSLISSNIPPSIDVTIRGRKIRLDKVTSSEFNAFLDFSDVDNTNITQISLEQPGYNGNEEISILRFSPRNVNIKVEKIIQQEFLIDMIIDGELPSPYHIVNLKRIPESVLLKDIESIIKSVDKVFVAIDLNQLLYSSSTNKRLSVHDAEGRVIHSLNGSIQVAIEYDIAKSVPVEIVTRGRTADDTYIEDTGPINKTVQLIGNYEVLKDIEYISAEILDIQDQDTSFTQDLNLIIPPNTRLYNNDETVSAFVNIAQFTSRLFTVSKSNITIYGADTLSDIKYSILDETSIVELKGPGNIVNSVNTSNISFYVDVANLDEGIHELPVKLILPENVYEGNTAYIKVLIEREVTEEENEPIADIDSDLESEIEGEQSE